MSTSTGNDMLSSVTIDVSPPLFTASDLSTDPICRICRCEESDPSALISPCLCSGSLAHVHPTCLQEWITLRPSTLAAEDEALSTSLPAHALPSSSLTCEMCHTPYAITFTSQPLPFSCNRHLFPLLLDITAHVFFFIVSSYLILSFPPSTLPSFVKPLLFAALTVFALISLHLSVRRWRRSRSTLVIQAVEREVKAEVVVESEKEKEWSEHLLERGDSEKEQWMSISSLPAHSAAPPSH